MILTLNIYLKNRQTEDKLHGIFFLLDRRVTEKQKNLRDGPQVLSDGCIWFWLLENRFVCISPKDLLNV